MAPKNITIVGCTYFSEGPPVSPGESASSEQPIPGAQEDGDRVILARVGLEVDPLAGKVSQINPDLGTNINGLGPNAAIIVNNFFDFKGATCTTCGPSCSTGNTRTVMVSLMATNLGSSPNPTFVTNVAIVNEVTSETQFTSLIPSPSTPDTTVYMDGDMIFPPPQVTVKLDGCDEFQVFFDLEGNIPGQWGSAKFGDDILQ